MAIYEYEIDFEVEKSKAQEKTKELKQIVDGYIKSYEKLIYKTKDFKTIYEAKEHIKTLKIIKANIRDLEKGMFDKGEIYEMFYENPEEIMPYFEWEIEVEILCELHEFKTYLEEKLKSN